MMICHDVLYNCVHSSFAFSPPTHARSHTHSKTEYISMEIMNEHGIATPMNFVANTPEEAEEIYTTKMNTREFCCQIVASSDVPSN